MNPMSKKPEYNHHIMTARQKIEVVAKLASQGKTYQEIAHALGYKSSGSISKYVRDAKAQGLIKTKEVLGNVE